jgi:hypothetical protein
MMSHAKKAASRLNKSHKNNPLAQITRVTNSI